MKISRTESRRNQLEAEETAIQIPEVDRRERGGWGQKNQPCAVRDARELLMALTENKGPGGSLWD
jgi:hypothetical protein